MTNKTIEKEVCRGLSTKRLADNQSFFWGVNAFTSWAFITATIYIVIKSFWESHAVFAIAVSLVYIFVNANISRLGKGYYKSITHDSTQDVKDRLRNSIDSSLNKNGFLKTFFYNPSKKGGFGFFYYPSIEKVVHPLFSRRELFSPFVYRIILVQALFSHLFILYCQQQALLKEVVITMLVCLLSGVFWHLWLNKNSFFAFVANLKEMGLDETFESVIVMNRSIKQTQSLLKEELRSGLSGTPLDISSDATNTLWDLYYDTVETVFEFNDFKALVLDKQSFFQDSINDILYIVNEMLPKRIKATEAFFNSYGSADPHSLNVFKGEVVSKMHEEYLEYSVKLKKFKELLSDAKEIDKRYVAQNIYLDDRIEDTKHINVDAVSNHLYPELRGLEFSSLKNRVAAQNISSNLLPELHSLLELAENQEDIDNIKSQIEDVKHLLFSLSDGKSTENKDSENILNLTSNQDNSSLISQTLSRQKIYMRSYKDKA